MSETSSAGPNKRLALFLDGTWNVVSDNTNVWRLRSLFAPVGADEAASSALITARAWARSSVKRFVVECSGAASTPRSPVPTSG